MLGERFVDQSMNCLNIFAVLGLASQVLVCIITLPWTGHFQSGEEAFASTSIGGMSGSE